MNHTRLDFKSIAALSFFAVIGCSSTKTLVPGTTVGTAYLSPGVVSPTCEVFIIGTNLNARCDNNGQFVFSKVPPGQWKLQFFSEPVTPTNRQSVLTNKVVVTVSSSQNVSLPTVVLAKAGLISGQITQGGAAVNPASLLSVSAIAVSDTGELAQPDLAGDYLLDLAPPGTVRLVLIVPNHGTVVHDPVTVQPGTVTANVNFDLQQAVNAPAILDGKAQRAYTTGSQSGIQIQLIAEQAQTVIAGAVTDSTGSFSFSGVAPGAYLVRATDPGNPITTTLPGVVLSSGETRLLDVVITVFQQSDLPNGGGDAGYPFDYSNGGLDTSDGGISTGGFGTPGACSSDTDCPGAFCNNGTCGICRFNTDCSVGQYCDVYGGGACKASVGTWIASGPLSNPLEDNTLTVLSNGQVLVAGGYNGTTPQSATALYTSGTGTWSTAGPMAHARQLPTATLLPSGDVLVAGGFDGTSTLASAEIYNATNHSWSSAASMQTARDAHAAVLLQSGDVLVFGGFDGTNALASAEIYVPRTDSWKAAASLASARSYAVGVVLQNGKVLAVGGSTPNSVVGQAEIYDPGTNTWSSAGSLDSPRYSHTATLLQNGQVLVTGGTDRNVFFATSQIYDPATNHWSSTGNLLSARELHAATLLSDGRVLVTGGYGASGVLSSVELYNPATGSWGGGNNLLLGRSQHTQGLLQNGKVLLTGGFNGSGYVSESEIFSPQ